MVLKIDKNGHSTRDSPSKLSSNWPVDHILYYDFQQELSCNYIDTYMSFLLWLVAQYPSSVQIKSYAGPL